MGRAPLSLKSSLLRQVYKQTAASGSNTGASLLEVIEAAQSAVVDSFKPGSVVTSTSGAGRSVSFTITTNLGPEMLNNAWEELWRMLCRLQKAGEEDDAKNYQAMIDALDPETKRKRNVGAHFTYLRIPATLT